MTGAGRDPWAFQRWAFAVKTGNTSRKAVLMTLATMVDTNTGCCEAKQETLAEAVETTARTVRAALSHLEHAGLIARKPQRRLDGSRRNDKIVLVAPWITEWPDGEPIAPVDPGPIDQPEAFSACTNRKMTTDQPENNDRTNRKQFPGKNVPPLRGGTLGNLPSGAKENEVRKRARASLLARQLPDGFPSELIEHARIVFNLLSDVAVQHNAREVTLRGVGLAIVEHQGRRYVNVAYALAGWAQAPPRPIRDVVATYRSFLERAQTFAGIERLDASGVPSAPATPAAGGRAQPADRRDAELAQLADELRSQGQ